MDVDWLIFDCYEWMKCINKLYSEQHILTATDSTLATIHLTLTKFFIVWDVKNT